MNRKIFFLLLTVLFFSSEVFAQDAAAPSAGSDIPQEYIMLFMLVVLFFMAGVILLLLNWVNSLAEYIRKLERKEKGIEEKAGQEDLITKFFRKVEHSLTDAVPVEREKEIEFAHEYDGIRELDNSLPPWWKYLFYVSIVFAVVYLYRYHVAGSAPLSAEEYKQEMATAELERMAYLEEASNLVNETSVVALTASSELESGRKVYTNLCVPCHGSLGEGKATLGPNLTDDYWIHGGSIKDIFKTVKYGVQGKAMISWQDQLSPRQMQEVSSYILTLQGTNPPNAKEPEGEKYVPEASSL